MSKIAVFLYDFTGLMAKPWLESGYECWLFDGQHPKGITRDGNLYRVGMWFNPDFDIRVIKMLVGNCDFVFGFPECTNLAVSGAAHFASKLQQDPMIQINAVKLARLVESLGNLFDCPWGLENPISVMSSIWRKPDYIFHPYEYGGYLPDDDVNPIYPEYIKPRDAYPKKTCIWSGNNFIMPEKKPVPVDSGYSDQYKLLGGKSLKTKNIRSATPRGFAKAVCEANKK